MACYPINVNLHGRKCIVVGGGAVAERKVRSLLDFGADVTVIAPDVTAYLRKLAATGKLTHIGKEYSSEALEGAFLVIAATDDPAVNRAVSLDAQSRGILVNVADEPSLCTFFVSAFVRRGDLVISVSTSGKSPALARRIREELESLFGVEYGYLVDILGELREEVKAKYKDEADRRKAYERILDSDVIRLLAEGKHTEAVERARACI
jgi:precorrin-2 dehydrogenase/sirohydrochlorin ferrochelatase